MITLSVPDADLGSVELASPMESVDLTDFDKPKWALMALDPSGKRQLLVRKLVSGIESDAMVFREMGGQGSPNGDGNNESKLSVAKWNRKPHAAAKMARGSREVRVAQLLAGSERQAGRFAKLLAAQDMAGGYRESWWEYYNLGDMQDLHTSALRPCQPQPPLSLVFRCVAQCLEGIQRLNGELGVRHMDVHAGNIFFHMANEGAAWPDAVIGDFGHSRFGGERPPQFTQEELDGMGPESRETYLSPPISSDEAFGTEDYSWRPRWDVHQFHLKIREVLLERFSGKKANNELLFNLFRRMARMSAQDEVDRKLPGGERPPVQDLGPLIQDAWALARLYAETTSDKVALRQVREKLLEELRRHPSEPQVFGDEGDARGVFEQFIDAGMLRVVNLFDDGSVEAAAAELASFKVPGSAYVVSSDNHHHQSETGSSSGSRDSSSSRPSTPWSPATRGLAEASAFAGGDASALDGLLAARDAEERRQALIREEHARRYRRQRGLSQLFRRE